MRYIRPACGRMVRFAERGTMRGSAKRFDAHARADYALPPPSVGVKAASRHVAFPHRGARETVHPALVYRFSKTFPLGFDFRYHESWQGNPVLLD